MKSRLSPVAYFAVCRSKFYRGLRCDQAYNDVRSMAVVQFIRKHYAWPDLRRVCAWKCSDYDVNLSRDAIVASRRSSSDQESDQSTRRPPPRSASCCAQFSTFPASSAGSIRTTLISDSSLALRTMAFVPPFKFNAISPPAYSNTGTRKSSPKPILNLPDLDQAKSAVLNSLPSKESQRGYRHAIDEFITWYLRQIHARYGNDILATMDELTCSDSSWRYS